MAFCSQFLSGIASDCHSNVGGLRVAYIANWDNGITLTSNDGVISAIVHPTGEKFKPYQIRKGSSSMTSTFTKDNATGVGYVETELSLVFHGMNAANNEELSNLLNAEVACIVEDENGSFYYLGADAPVRISGGNAMSGAQKGDVNAYSVTLKDESREMPLLVSASAIADVVSEKISTGLR